MFDYSGKFGVTKQMQHNGSQNKMENKAYEKEKDCDHHKNKIKEIKIQLETRATPQNNADRHDEGNHSGGSSNNNRQPHYCKPEVCRKARLRHQQSPSGSMNPWHRNKTYYLIATIILLAIWIVVYTLLSVYGVL